MKKLLVVGMIAAAATAVQARAPRLLFLPVENIGGRQNHAYIGRSVTDDLRKRITEEFAVKEAPEPAWKSTASANDFIYPDEYYTRSVALQLGILLRQDVVLSGGYRVAPRKGGGPDVASFDVYLQGVKDRKIISHITFDTPVDTTLFSRMNELRDKVVVELAKVLPNRRDAARYFYEADVISFRNQLMVAGGTTLGLSPAPRTEIPATGELSFNPGDFALTPSISFQYRRLNVHYEGFQYHLGAAFSFGSREMDLVDATNAVNVNHYAVSVFIGPGYRYGIWRGLYVLFQLGGGFHYGKAVIDLSIAGKNVTDPVTGERIDESVVDFYGPAGRADMILGYTVFGNLSVEAGGGYRVFYGAGEVSQQALAYAGVVLGF